MKIVCDENILLAQDFFATLPNGETAELVLKSGRSITQADLTDADALMVRSVTKVDAALLNGTSIKFVGTATIGTDHIDQADLRQKGVVFADAAGCSKHTVAQYVLTAIHHCRPSFFLDAVPTIGIVGMGNIGTVLAQYAFRLGWQVLCCDPFKPATITLPNGKTVNNLPLRKLVEQVHVLSVHVPLTQAGDSDYPTHHLIHAGIFGSMKHGALLINTARGAVVREADLLESLENSNLTAVLDVFEHEPTVSKSLLDNLAVATPHIAGYSVEGKARGTQLVYEAFCKWLGAAPTLDFSQFLPDNPYVLASSKGFKRALGLVLPDWYGILADDAALRDCLKGDNVDAMRFDGLRKNYKLRREWAVLD